MPAAAPGIVETGAPSFVVLGPEAIGLSMPPTDLHLLPNGRVLVVAQREIAYGDGVRWELFRGDANVETIFDQVAVADDGRIYMGSTNGISRVDFNSDARWTLTEVAHMPSNDAERPPTLISVEMLPQQWLWHAQNGGIFSWRPGATLKPVGKVNSVKRIFSHGQDLFVSEPSSGALYRIRPDSAGPERITPDSEPASEAITCTLEFSPGKLLLGTISAGLKTFDGSSFKPFGQPGLLTSGFQISDLCATSDGYFAAAIDTVGIVFFDREGHVIQVLDRALDHRLGRVKRLAYAKDGVLWALLNDGVARIEFPSPYSQFEPLVLSGLAYAKPLRHAGKLWILADGRAMRGLYDNSGRLERFELDSPPGRYLFTLADDSGDLMAANDAGVYRYEAGHWRLVLPGLVNARVGIAHDPVRGSLYAARGEIGFIKRRGNDLSVERFPVPGLGDTYGSARETDRIAWVELGTTKVGRIDFRGPEPIFDFLGAADGLKEGWVELFPFDGAVVIHVPQHVFKFDEASHRFVPDEGLAARYPQFLDAGGRPVRDKFGRTWLALAGNVQVIDPAVDGVIPAPRTEPVGFSPTEFTVEDDGTIWMFSARHMVRRDAKLPFTPAAPLRALITSVQFPGRNLHVFNPQGALAPVEYADNSLIVHFAAPGNPFRSTVAFEVLLEGAGSEWVSTGTVGSASFNRLKEGHYVFHVRPVAGESGRGEAARLEFDILPPWYRTPLAWTTYASGAVLLIGFIAWFPAFQQRREKARLERLVDQRTQELRVTNQQLVKQIDETVAKSAALSASEERYRTLNTGLEQRVSERTSELSHSNKELQQRESLFRLIFEHAPVGISWKRADLGAAYHVNSTFRRILDLPEDAQMDYSILSKLAHPEDAPRRAELDKLLLSGKTDSYSIEERFILKDGRTVWASFSVAVVRDESGRIVQDIGILEDITGRKRAEEELAKTYKNLMDASRMAGMAEVATGVLHNVGNVLNSLNVSANLITTSVRQSKVDSLVKLSAIVNSHLTDLGDFLTNDRKGKLVPEVLAQIAQQSVAERDALLKEIQSMQGNIDHIKDIVNMQQGYATAVGLVEVLDPSGLFEDALRMNSAALSRHDVTVVREYLPVPPVRVEKGKVLQILINLIRNAKYACDDGQKLNPREKVLTMRIERDDDRVRLIVRDNGIGIPQENITRIFAHGFTTRAYGHGFGLHSSALAAKEMKGSLTAHSDGEGTGAMFVLELPVEEETIHLSSSGTPFTTRNTISGDVAT